MLSVGRICVKTAGRETGKFCIVVDVLEEKFVLVTGPRAVTHVKRRKCNIEHLEPTPEVLKIAKNASDDDVISAYKREGIFEKMGAKAPSAQEIQHAKEAEQKRSKMAKEKAKEEKHKPPEEKPEAHKKEEKKHKKHAEHKEKKKEHKEKPHKKPEHKPAKKKAKPAKKTKRHEKPAKKKKK